MWEDDKKYIKKKKIIIIIITNLILREIFIFKIIMDIIVMNIKLNYNYNNKNN